MIREYHTKPWTLCCDECEEFLGSDDFGGTTLFDTRRDAEEAVAEHDWIEGDAGQHFCSEECASDAAARARDGAAT